MVVAAVVGAARRRWIKRESALSRRSKVAVDVGDHIGIVKGERRDASVVPAGTIAALATTVAVGLLR